MVSGHSLLLSGIGSLELPNLPPEIVTKKSDTVVAQDGHGDLKKKYGMVQVRDCAACFVALAFSYPPSWPDGMLRRLA